jgi:ATP-dependent DNA ligase
LITGASRGQGAAEAQLFAAEGAAVVLTDVLDGGIVSKRRDKPYQSRPSKSWLKIKNPQSPAMLRLQS